MWAGQEFVEMSENGTEKIVIADAIRMLVYCFKRSVNINLFRELEEGISC